MSDLNENYYGPSIPPPSKSYPHPGRRSRCSTCINSCICGILQIIFSILVLVAIVILLIYFILRPNMIKFYATNASLTEFSFDTKNNTLHYNLVLNLTIRNPNKRLGIHYEEFEVRGLYEGQSFANTNIQPFQQGHKNTTFLYNVVLKGQNRVVLSDDGLSEYNKDQNKGRFNVEVKLYFRLRFMVGFVKSWDFKPRIECNLNVPLNQTSSSTDSTFETTKCDLDWHL